MGALATHIHRGLDEDALLALCRGARGGGLYIYGLNIYGDTVTIHVLRGHVCRGEGREGVLSEPLLGGGLGQNISGVAVTLQVLRGHVSSATWGGQPDHF